MNSEELNGPPQSNVIQVDWTLNAWTGRMEYTKLEFTNTPSRPFDIVQYEAVNPTVLDQMTKLIDTQVEKGVLPKSQKREHLAAVARIRAKSETLEDERIGEPA